MAMEDYASQVALVGLDWEPLGSSMILASPRNLQGLQHQSTREDKMLFSSSLEQNTEKSEPEERQEDEEHEVEDGDHISIQVQESVVLPRARMVPSSGSWKKFRNT